MEPNLPDFVFRTDPNISEIRLSIEQMEANRTAVEDCRQRLDRKIAQFHEGNRDIFEVKCRKLREELDKTRAVINDLIADWKTTVSKSERQTDLLTDITNWFVSNIMPDAPDRISEKQVLQAKQNEREVSSLREQCERLVSDMEQFAEAGGIQNEKRNESLEHQLAVRSRFQDARAVSERETLELIPVDDRLRDDQQVQDLLRAIEMKEGEFSLQAEEIERSINLPVDGQDVTPEQSVVRSGEAIAKIEHEIDLLREQLQMIIDTKAAIRMAREENAGLRLAAPNMRGREVREDMSVVADKMEAIAVEFERYAAEWVDSDKFSIEAEKSREQEPNMLDPLRERLATMNRTLVRLQILGSDLQHLPALENKINGMFREIQTVFGTIGEFWKGETGEEARIILNKIKNYEDIYNRCKNEEGALEKANDYPLILDELQALREQLEKILTDNPPDVSQFGSLWSKTEARRESALLGKEALQTPADVEQEGNWLRRYLETESAKTLDPGQQIAARSRLKHIFQRLSEEENKEYFKAVLPYLAVNPNIFKQLRVDSVLYAEISRDMANEIGGVNFASVSIGVHGVKSDTEKVLNEMIVTEMSLLRDLQKQQARLDGLLQRKLVTPEEYRLFNLKEQIKLHEGFKDISRIWEQANPGLAAEIEAAYAGNDFAGYQRLKEQAKNEASFTPHMFQKLMETYADLEVMGDYFSRLRLSTVTFNRQMDEIGKLRRKKKANDPAVAEFCNNFSTINIQPVQRGPRHEMLLKEIQISFRKMPGADEKTQTIAREIKKLEEMKKSPGDLRDAEGNTPARIIELQEEYVRRLTEEYQSVELPALQEKITGLKARVAAGAGEEAAEELRTLQANLDCFRIFRAVAIGLQSVSRRNAEANSWVQ